MIDTVTSTPSAPIGGGTATIPAGGAWDVPAPDVDTIQRTIIDAASQVPIPDNDQIQQLLSQRRQQLWQRREAKAQAAVRRRAIQAQRGSEDLVDTPEGLAARYQQTYEAQAETLYATQVTNEAQQKLNELQQEHRFDPEGFTREWSQYTHDVVQRLSEAKIGPDLLERSLQTLMGYGVQTRQQIQDAAFARHQRVQSYNYRTSMDKTRSTAVQQLLAHPNEEQLVQYRQHWLTRVEAGVASGYLTPTQGANLRTEGLRVITSAYVRGRFHEAMEAGDIDLAHQVIRGLKQGRWFHSIEAGRELAQTLASQLEAQQAAVRAVLNDRVSSALTSLQRRKEIAQAGESILPMDSPEISHSMNVILRYGTAEQKREALQVLRATQINTIISKNMGYRSPEEIQTLQDAVTQKFRQGKIEESVYEDFMEASNDRLAEIAEAKQTNNVKSLQPTPINFEAAESEGNAAAQARLRDTVHAARQAGVPPSQVHVYSTDQVDQLLDTYSNADTIEQRLRIVEAIVANTPEAYMPSVKARFADTALGAQLTLMANNPESGRVLSTWAAQGRTLPEQQAVDYLDAEIRSSKLTETATILAHGHPVLRSSLQTMFRESLEGLAANYIAQGMAPVDARQAALEEWTQRTKVYRQGGAVLTNGVTVDMDELAGAKYKPVDMTAAINDFMLHSDAFETLRANNALMGQIFPVRLPSGDIGFTSTVSPGSLLTTPSGEPIIMAEEQIQQFANDPNNSRAYALPDARGRFDWTLLNNEQRYNLNTEPVTTDNNSVAQQLGAVGADSLSAVAEGQLQIAREVVSGGHRWAQAARLAVNDMSPEALGTRNPDTGLSQERLAEVAQTTAYKQAMKEAANELNPGGATPREVPLPSDSRLGTFVASHILLNKLRARYDSPRVAVAHYWLTENEVRMLKDAYGDDWYAHMPDDAALFVERVVGIHARQQEQ